MATTDQGVVFNGRRIVHPGAYDAIDTSGMVTSSQGSLDVPIVVGTADAGEPGKVVWFSNPTSGHNYVKGGDLYTAIDLMFSPRPEGGGGVSLLGVLVVNSLVQASLSTSGVSQTSLEYGEGGNRIQAKLEDGTLAGTKKYTVQRWDENTLEVYDNLGALFQIQYTGTQTYAAVTTTATTIKTKVGVDQATAVDDLNIDLTDSKFSTFGDIMSYIAGVSDYEIVQTNAINTNESVGTPNLVVVTNSDIKTSAKPIISIKANFEYLVNNQSNLVSVTVDESTIQNFPISYLTGGAKGDTPASWAAHFDTIKKQFSDILVVLSSSSSIHAEALAHVSAMETRNQKQMLFTGGAVGESVAQVKQRAVSLNSSRAVLGYPAIYYSGVNSGKAAIPAYFTGAMIAGRVAGVDPTEPITGDLFNLISLENTLVNGDPEIDDLITSGVATMEQIKNGAIRLSHAVTTYLGTDNPIYNEISVRRGADSLSDTMRQSMEDAFVGTKGLALTSSSIVTKAIDVLEQAIKDERIAAYDRNSIVVTQSGTSYSVDYRVAPVEPVNFVLVTTHFVTQDSITSTQTQG